MTNVLCSSCSRDASHWWWQSCPSSDFTSFLLPKYLEYHCFLSFSYGRMHTFCWWSLTSSEHKYHNSQVLLSEYHASTLETIFLLWIGSLALLQRIFSMGFLNSYVRDFLFFSDINLSWSSVIFPFKIIGQFLKMEGTKLRFFPFLTPSSHRCSQQWFWVIKMHPFFEIF